MRLDFVSRGGGACFMTAALRLPIYSEGSHSRLDLFLPQMMRFPRFAGASPSPRGSPGTADRRIGELEKRRTGERRTPWRILSEIRDDQPSLASRNLGPYVCAIYSSIILTILQRQVATQTAAMTASALPSDFEWGFATAAYQIEGAVNEGGRGKCIWDTFCHLEPSRTKNAHGDVACDHYHRFEDDFDLLSKYGAGAYRFSIAWSRIIPLGGRNDAVNEQGIDFYNRLIDSLLRRGIKPWVTLYHWDLPQALHDRYGGWLNVEEVQKDFERYSRLYMSVIISGTRGKKEKLMVRQGYATGGNAPGRSSTNPQCTEGDTAREPWIVGKALIMSHARAVVAYNQDFRQRQRGTIGISLNGDYYEPWDAASSQDTEAAERRMEFHIGWFANPIFLAKDYPDSMRKQLGNRLPAFSEEDFATLAAAETDFYGMNYYTSQFARHRAQEAPETDVLGNVQELQSNKQGESVGAESGVHWLRSCPDLFRKHLTRVYRLYKKPIYITENGCPCPGEDQMTKEESVNDPFRLQYFKDHLDAIGKSRQDGAVISGYFAWSLMDNLEWSDGFGPRFGVTYTDYETLERTPKKSALLLQELIAERQQSPPGK
ncbi:beta-glucosidase, putative [Cordyceps militaris CM01]|uniref:beta-glucosidase n=1 Tax=Cordyceps militaris (strain CM01) TaxID=983644 RepID=G3JIT9_CORMM|nr:beta-glucosidase, putative [Cordyceps militaris CM01]EGX91138.1 beta-glucosidase, putative [Cordyceps militaris CM01]